MDSKWKNVVKLISECYLSSFPTKNLFTVALKSFTFERHHHPLSEISGAEKREEKTFIEKYILFFFR